MTEAALPQGDFKLQRITGNWCEEIKAELLPEFGIVRDLCKMLLICSQSPSCLFAAFSKRTSNEPSSAIGFCIILSE